MKGLPAVTKVGEGFTSIFFTSSKTGCEMFTSSKKDGEKDLPAVRKVGGGGVITGVCGSD